MNKIFVLFFLLTIQFYGFAQKKEGLPNIVYIMSDDHGYQAVSSYGYNINETPNIDRIANEGALFTRATVTNSLCAPSRAVMLTGKHSHINGKIDISNSTYDWDQDNFVKHLQKNGYQTAIIGKCHLPGLPQGFDYSAVLPGQGDYYNPNFIIDGDTQQISGYVTDITTDLSLEWLENRDESKPFCVLVHHKAPHREWLPALRHIEKFSKMQVKEPKTLFDDFEGRGTAAKSAEMNILDHMNWAGDSKVPPGLMDKMGIEETAGWDKGAYKSNLGRMTKDERKIWDNVYDSVMVEFEQEYPEMTDDDLMRWRYQRYMQDYLGSIASVDEGVGQILDFLEANGLDENTIVIYTSDQGFYLGEHGWFDKRFMYEESLKTPLVMRFPSEIKPQQQLDALVQNLDFAPTILDYAGLDIPKDMQGESFRGILNGQKTNWRDFIYYHYYAYPAVHMVKRHYGIRTDQFKLIHFYHDVNEWELYDLKEDPNELNNVYDSLDYVNIRKSMHLKLNEARVKYRDSLEYDQWFIENDNNTAKFSIGK